MLRLGRALRRGVGEGETNCIQVQGKLSSWAGPMNVLTRSYKILDYLSSEVLRGASNAWNPFLLLGSSRRSLNSIVGWGGDTLRHSPLFKSFRQWVLTAQEIVNWVTTAEECVHTDATRLRCRKIFSDSSRLSPTTGCSIKKHPLHIFIIFTQMLTNFNNSFTAAFSDRPQKRLE